MSPNKCDVCQTARDDQTFLNLWLNKYDTEIYDSNQLSVCQKCYDVKSKVYTKLEECKDTDTDTNRYTKRGGGNTQGKRKSKSKSKSSPSSQMSNKNMTLYFLIYFLKN